MTVSNQLGELLDGLLEPVAEDRLTAREAVSVALGRAAEGSTRRPTQALLQPAAAGQGQVVPQASDTLPRWGQMQLPSLSAGMSLRYVKAIL